MDEIFIADLKDEFEQAGQDNTEFSIYSFINDDIKRAFCLGYFINEWNLWIPFKARKELRHLHEDIIKYNPQLEWLNTKCSNTANMLDYVNYILDNIIVESHRDLIKVAISLGNHLNKNKKDA